MLVELRVGDGEVPTRLDCRVEADPSATVGDLREALTRHATDRDIEVPAGVSLWSDADDRLDDDTALPLARVASGQRLWLRSTAPPPRPLDVAVEVSVVAGPDLGPAVVLGAGTHTVGGTSDDDVALVGGCLPRAAATIGVAEDGTVDRKSVV